MTTLYGSPKYLFYVGTIFSVEWYFDGKGKMEGKEYYEGLSKEEKYRLHYMIAFLADSPMGTRLSRNLYNLEDSENKIYAFKPKDHRFFNFMTAGKKVIIINAYRKNAQQMTKKDLNVLRRAISAKVDYLKRTKEGTYYERFTE